MVESAYWFLFYCFFFFKQKTAYEMSIGDWSSDVCSSDLKNPVSLRCLRLHNQEAEHHLGRPNRLGENKLSHRLPDRGHRAGPHDLGRPNRLGENKLSHRLPDRGHRAGPHGPLRHFSQAGGGAVPLGRRSLRRESAEEVSLLRLLGH